MKFILTYLSLVMVCSAQALAASAFRALTAVPAELSVPSPTSRFAARSDFLETITLPTPSVNSLTGNEVELAFPGSQPLFADGMP
jgi:hypothetical protein